MNSMSPVSVERLAESPPFGLMRMLTDASPSPDAALAAASVRGDLPGPRSAELLARQARWESNARTYPRHLPIAIARASGSFVQDLDGNVFIDGSSRDPGWSGGG